MASTQAHLLALPRELRDQIYGDIFERTPYDYSGTRKVTLRILDKYAVLRRTCATPPPSWKGCRNVMTVCRQLSSEVYEYLYSQIIFEVRISGTPPDPKLPIPQRNRITSEYPIGRTSTCRILPFLRQIDLRLDAWSLEELERLKGRLQSFLKAATALDVRKIGLYFDDHSRWFSDDQAGMPLAGDVALMLANLKSRTSRVEVYNPRRTVPNALYQDLLESIDGVDCTETAF